MAVSDNLRKAKRGKNDEFYTMYEDIQAELNHYEKHFVGKVVLCNCDDPFESNFCKFFLRNFNHLKLKRLICTSYNSSPVAGTQLSFFDITEDEVQHGHGYVLDVTKVPMANGRGVSDDDIDKLLRSKKWVKELKGDGDFRSEECVEFLKQADIVVTNPPFSLFREYVAQLIEFDKKFVIIGNQNAITYKEIFPLLKENKMWIGCRFNRRVNGENMKFRVPDSYPMTGTEVETDKNGIKYISVAGTGWFTNLDIEKRHEKLILYKTYTPEEYAHYDNYDAINVDKTADIPMDYDGVMGVPISFMDKFSPEQFEILGITDRQDSYGFRTHKYTTDEYSNANDLNARACILVDGKPKAMYARILIRRKEKK